MKIARVMIAGTHSGCGKTTVASAVMRALRVRGMRLHAFKNGPDYIDPTFHRVALGIASDNLDGYLCAEETLISILADGCADGALGIVEGAMGFCDGGAAGAGSCADLALRLQLPVVLVVDARGMAQSVNAIVRGFRAGRGGEKIAGVVLNRVNRRTYEKLKGFLEEEFGKTIPVLGYLPPLGEEYRFPSRRLGLVEADRLAECARSIERLGKIAEECVDLDGIAVLAQSAVDLPYFPRRKSGSVASVRIAVARDEAFCFYYDYNLRLLRSLGAELIEFSPLRDDFPIADGLLIGGGYPELYLQALASNVKTRRAILDALRDGMPYIAEGGGFMYLNQSIDGVETVGYFNGACTDTGVSTRFGYAQISSEKADMVCGIGSCVRGHEFHYYDCDANGEDYAVTRSGGETAKAGFSDCRGYAGWIQLHWGSDPDVALRFAEACERYRSKRSET